MDKISSIASPEWAVIIRKYVCCAEIWRGMGLMFFYQFAGYNVVSFYAASIIQHPQATEGYLRNPTNKTAFAKPGESPTIENE